MSFLVKPLPPHNRTLVLNSCGLANGAWGKTGLGWRLAQGEFNEHYSTHGQQFWVIP